MAAASFCRGTSRTSSLRRTSLIWSPHLRQFTSGRTFCRVFGKSTELKQDGTFLICNECGGDNKKDEKWTEKIDGMTIYKDVQLKNILEQAGFRNIQIHKSEKGWLCITAQK